MYRKCRGCEYYLVHKSDEASELLCTRYPPAWCTDPTGYWFAQLSPGQVEIGCGEFRERKVDQKVYVTGAEE